MNTDEVDTQCSPVSVSQGGWNKSASVAIGLTVLTGLVAMLLVRPWFARRLEVRSASADLASDDYSTRRDAIRRLRSWGEESESQLISLLQHSDAGVRSFAAEELAHRTAITESLIEVFLLRLEQSQPAEELVSSMPSLSSRHAKRTTGPLTKQDQRMINWLRSQLGSANSDERTAAAWALTAFVNRAPSLQKVLVDSIHEESFYSRYIVLRELVPHDPALNEEYIEMLLSGLGSPLPNDQRNAAYGLTHLHHEPQNLKARLKTQRSASEDPSEIQQIDGVLDILLTRPSSQLPQANPD